jgi:hypothetical protein
MNVPAVPSSCNLLSTCWLCIALQVWYFDFLPLRPTHPATAAMLLSASAAPGGHIMSLLLLPCTRSTF